MASAGVGGSAGAGRPDRRHRRRGSPGSAPRHVPGSALMGVGIRVSGLNAWFGKTQALRDIDLEVPANHATAIIGPSGGQQQRLCIARALAVEPEVMLMDEPASALDPISTAKIEDLIFQLKENYTIVIVTHNMQQAARVAEFTGFFLLGELVEFDKTQKIFTTPADKRTEDYITGRFG